MWNRWGLSRDKWWLILMLGLATGPVLAAVFAAGSVAVLANVRELGAAPAPVVVPDPPLAPAGPIPAPTGNQLQLTVLGEGEVFLGQGDSCVSGQTCVVNFDADSELRLGAEAGLVPGSNARFLGWGGDCASFGGEQYPVLVMDSPKNCTARFTPN